MEIASQLDFPGIITRQLFFDYAKGKSFTFPDIHISPGDDLLVSGQSGTGKTTLLHLLSGILTASSGQIFFGRVAFHELNQREKDDFRGKNIGMVFQRHWFIEGFNMLDNLRIVQQAGSGFEDLDYIMHLCQSLGVSHLLKKLARELSEGEKQRFSVVRALSKRPGWVFADEPTSGLDDYHTGLFLNFVALSKKHLPVGWIVASHDKRLKEFFTRLYSL